MCVPSAGPSIPDQKDEERQRSTFARVATDALARIREQQESRNTPVRIDTTTPELRAAMEPDPTTRLSLRIPRIRTSGSA